MDAEILERLVRIEAGLAEHMRRTAAAEDRLAMVEDRVLEFLRHQAAWAGAGKALTVLGTVAGILGVLWKALG